MFYDYFLIKRASIMLYFMSYFSSLSTKIGKLYIFLYLVNEYDVWLKYVYLKKYIKYK